MCCRRVDPTLAVRIPVRPMLNLVCRALAVSCKSIVSTHTLRAHPNTLLVPMFTLFLIVLSELNWRRKFAIADFTHRPSQHIGGLISSDCRVSTPAWFVRHGGYIQLRELMRWCRVCRAACGAAWFSTPPCSKGCFLKRCLRGRLRLKAAWDSREPSGTPVTLVLFHQVIG